MGSRWKKNRLDSIFVQWRGYLKIVEAIADTIFAPKGSSEWFAQLESKQFFSSDRPHNLYHSTFSHKSEKSPDCSEDLSDYILHRGYVLYNSLSLHCIYNFFKSGNVSTYYIVSFCSVTFCCVCCVMADIYHDVLKFCVNFFECPAETFAVL